jgi:hypothetical protein
MQQRAPYAGKVSMLQESGEHQNVIYALKLHLVRLTPAQPVHYAATRQEQPPSKQEARRRVSVCAARGSYMTKYRQNAFRAKLELFSHLTMGPFAFCAKDIRIRLVLPHMNVKIA